MRDEATITPDDAAFELPMAEPTLGLLVRLKFAVLRNRIGQIINRSPLKLLLVILFVAMIWAALFLLFDSGFRFMRRFQQAEIIAIPYVFHIFFVAMTALLAFSTAVLVYGGLFGRAEPAFLMASPSKPRNIVAIMYFEALFFSSWFVIAAGRAVDARVWRGAGPALALLSDFHRRLSRIRADPRCVGLDRRLCGRALPAQASAARALLRMCRHHRVDRSLLGTTLGRVIGFVHRVGDEFRCGAAIPQSGGTPLYLGIQRNPLRRREPNRRRAVLSGHDGIDRLVLQLGGHQPDRHSPAEGLRPRSRGDEQVAGVQRFCLAIPDVHRILLRSAPHANPHPQGCTHLPARSSAMVSARHSLRAARPLPRLPAQIPAGRLHHPLEGLDLLPELRCGHPDSVHFHQPIRVPNDLAGSRQIWLVALWPLERADVLWSKLFYAGTVTASAALLVTYMSIRALELPWELGLIQGCATLTTCLGLCGLAIGLGAKMPSYEEPNAGRIASGLGGTINLIASVGFVAISVCLFGWICLRLVGSGALDAIDSYNTAIFAALILIGIGTTWGTMRMGVRHFTRQQF